MVSIALDAQGAKVARPWHEVANATFTTLVDQENVLGNLYGLKAIPYALLVNENGVLVKGPFSVNIADKETQEELERWLTDADYEAKLIAEHGKPSAATRQTPELEEAKLRFQLGLLLLRKDKQDEAMTEWRKALELDPNNWIIHKQIWAVEHPERFYEGSVDYQWQKQQLEAEKTQ